MRDSREEGSKATLATGEWFGDIQGASGSDALHAESGAYNALLSTIDTHEEKLKQFADIFLEGGEHFTEEMHQQAKIAVFDIIVQQSTIRCDGHKASCFMCTAIAHVLNVPVEKKDQRGYGQYALPEIFRISTRHFEMLVGRNAYDLFTLFTVEQKNEIYRSFGSTLYEKHKGEAKNFKL